MRKRWLWLAAYLAVGIAGAVRVASTHRVFSEVLDEPAHVACGYEWLTGRGYATDMSHPPLERVLSAIPAVLEHVPAPPPELDFVGRGNTILYANDHYEHNLDRARLRTIPGVVPGAYDRPAGCLDQRPHVGILLRSNRCKCTMGTVVTMSSGGGASEQKGSGSQPLTLDLLFSRQSTFAPDSLTTFCHLAVSLAM